MEEIIDSSHCIVSGYELVILKYFFSNRGKKWHIIPAGMGCNIFLKHDGTCGNNKIYTFLMYAEEWGQYGTSRVRELVDFIPEDYEASLEAQEVKDYINSQRRAQG